MVTSWVSLQITTVAFLLFLSCGKIINPNLTYKKLLWLFEETHGVTKPTRCKESSYLASCMNHQRRHQLSKVSDTCPKNHPTWKVPWTTRATSTCPRYLIPVPPTFTQHFFSEIFLTFFYIFEKRSVFTILVGPQVRCKSITDSFKDYFKYFRIVLSISS